MNTFNLYLGHSELIYLLWLMKTLSLPGIGPKPFGGIPGVQVMASLTAAEQSLQARGLIASQDAGVRIDQQALILIGSCALAKASLMVESQTKDADPVALYYHFHSKIWVRRSLLEQGIHRFDLIESPVPDFNDLIANTPPSVNGNAPAELTLPREVLGQVFDLLFRSPLADINRTLANAGLIAQFAASVVDTLGSFEQKIFISVTYHNRAENMSGESVVLLRGQQGYWRLDSLVDAGAVKLMPLSRQAITDVFDRIVQQAQVN
jgi:hypothetical protein